MTRHSRRTSSSDDSADPAASITDTDGFLMRGDDDEAEEQFITLASITPTEWAKLKTLARKMLESGHYQGDQFKCAVAAFIEWIASEEREFAVAAEDDEVFH